MPKSIQIPVTTDECVEFSDRFWRKRGKKKPILWAIGTDVCTKNGTVASMHYPVVNGPGKSLVSAAAIFSVLNVQHEGVCDIPLTVPAIEGILRYFRPYLYDGGYHPNVIALQKAAALGRSGKTFARLVVIFDDIEPKGVSDSTLKLYGMSCRHFKPNMLNLSGMFGKFPNVVWDGSTPLDEEEVDERMMQAAFEGKVYAPDAADKFPLYMSCINPLNMGVRITDKNKVRLGAHLAEGTTVMPGASYINFNAGTLGASMVEGRISSSATVGAGTDVGGGASILGTLSGGNSTPISVGKNCLLEVHSIVGVPLGDCNIVSANTQILAGSKVRVLVPEHPLFEKTVKGIELAGISGVTIRRSDTNGSLEVVQTSRNREFIAKLEREESILNSDLHKN